MFSLFFFLVSFGTVNTAIDARTVNETISITKALLWLLTVKIQIIHTIFLQSQLFGAERYHDFP